MHASSFTAASHRCWFVLAIVFNFGIFVVSGICFWKWIITNIAFLIFASRGGAPIYNRMCRHLLVVLFGAAMVYLSLGRVYFNPQSGVAWYDTRMVEDYTFKAVGEKRQGVPAGSHILPAHGHAHSHRGGFATRRKGRSVTSIYGVTGSHRVLMRLEQLESPEDALDLLQRGRVCFDSKQHDRLKDFLTRFLGNLNKGGPRHRWLSWFGRPRHLWVSPQGELYDMQEPIDRVELWREVVVHQ